MCGIVGVIANRSVARILLSSLARSHNLAKSVTVE